LLFKNDIPFIPIKSAYDENLMLREKGIILQYFQSDFCFFPHKEYAQLIFDCMHLRKCIYSGIILTTTFVRKKICKTENI
jgi:hypothetical protein